MTTTVVAAPVLAVWAAYRATPLGDDAHGRRFRCAQRAFCAAAPGSERFALPRGAGVSAAHGERCALPRRASVSAAPGGERFAQPRRAAIPLQHGERFRAAARGRAFLLRRAVNGLRSRAGQAFPLRTASVLRCRTGASASAAPGGERFAQPRRTAIPLRTASVFAPPHGGERFCRAGRRAVCAAAPDRRFRCSTASVFALPHGASVSAAQGGERFQGRGELRGQPTAGARVVTSPKGQLLSPPGLRLGGAPTRP
ncbi:hypothetical protein [Streptomyces sp. NRRL F-5123]|uniref:hypothetical protein n=1 Tax=Streptomyces sp. NRRL F-5123 TaxID=1463856 RepID=UPI0019029787|nr:hypothetical protein [Streptomyces sp. NRRL F-5123]